MLKTDLMSDYNPFKVGVLSVKADHIKSLPQTALSSMKRPDYSTIQNEMRTNRTSNPIKESLNNST